MQIRGALFDFGSTLFAHAPLVDTIGGAARSLGTEISRSWAVDLAAAIDRSAHAPQELALGRDLSQDVWRERWTEMYAQADDSVPGLGAEIYRLMHDPQEWVPYPAAHRVLAALAAAGLKVGVVSNTGWDVRSVFEHHGLAVHVDGYCLSWQVGAVKPDPRIFLHALGGLGLDAAEVLMVGDDPSADSGAARTGVATLLLPATPPGVDNRLELVLGLCGIG